MRPALVLLATLLATRAPARASAPIVNGVAAADHPAVGALLSPSDPDRAQVVCSGTLIGCRTFLTAAHCVEDDPDPSAYVVYLQHAGFVGVNAVAVHPAYDFPVADVAVLTLAGPFTGVRPAALDISGGQPAGAAGTIVGFGRSGGASQDYGLKRKGAVALAPCAGGVSDATSICWDFESPVGLPGEDSNTCNGDSGGPLFVDGGDGLVVAGITSGGSSASCLATDHSYDVRVATYASYVTATGGPDVGAPSCSSLPVIGDPEVAVTTFAGVLGAAVAQAAHTVTVPSGTDRLRITMNAVDDGSDFDLYVRAGSPPTTTSFDCAANGTGQFGACEFADPAPGPWYVLLDRFWGSGGYQVTATTFASFCAYPANDGAPCDDGDACTTAERCTGGVCSGGGTVDCDDGVACTADACHPSAGCTHTLAHATCGACAACDPAAGCVVGPRPDCLASVAPAASLLKLRAGPVPAADLVVWKWTQGAATTAAELGMPALSTDYHLCLYDESGTTPGLAVAAAIPAATLCDGAPCWTGAGATLKYRNAARTPDGISKVVLKAGDTGRPKATVKGKGDLLPPLPALPLALPARVQLQADGAGCFEARFEAPGVVRNDGESFVGRGD